MNCSKTGSLRVRVIAMEWTLQFRRGADASVELVPRSRGAATRGGADLPAQLAVRKPHRTRARAGHLLHDGGELGLIPLRLETWGPLVFVNAGPEARALADGLGPIPQQVAEILDLDSLQFRFRSEFEVAANWKVVCENFLECYHCAVAHPGFSGVVDVSPDVYRLEADGLTSSQFGPLRPNGGSFVAGGEVARSQFHFLWPNFGINIFPGRPNLSCGSMLPAGPERTARFLDYFFAEEVDQDWIDELIAFDDQIGREDTALVEGVQRGIRSGVLDAGRLMPESERLVAHFQALCAEALTE